MMRSPAKLTGKQKVPRYTPAPPRAAYTFSYTTPGLCNRRRFAKTASGGIGSLTSSTDLSSSSAVSSGGLSAAIRTPGYFEKVSKGLHIPPTPLSGRRDRELLPEGRYAFTSDGSSVWTVMSGFRPIGSGGAIGDQGRISSFDFTPIFDPSLPNVALTRARLRLKEQKVNFAQAFAERGMTAKLLSETLSKVVRSLRALRSGRFRDAVHALELPGSATRSLSRSQNVASNWLAIQYGWKPLLSDLYGSAEALRARDEADPTRYKLFVKGSATKSTPLPPLYTNTLGLIPLSWCSWDYNHNTQKAKVRLDYNVNSEEILLLARSAGLINPLVVVWETVPFSFVADWFVPIGNYLNQLDASEGLIFVSGSLTEVWEREISLIYKGSTPLVDMNVRASRQASSFRRSIYTVEPSVRLPSFKNPVSPTHLANAAALLTVLRTTASRR